MADLFLSWNDALQRRHLAVLTFQEVRRSVQALSTIYVENRKRLDSGTVFDGAGKRAAFAMFYSPLHFLLVRHVVRSLNAGRSLPPSIVDLGCGTGAAGAAWALEAKEPPKLLGVEIHPWAVQESQWTYRTLGLQGTVQSADVRKMRIPSDAGVVAAFSMNEIDEAARGGLLDRIVKHAGRGGPVLIVEPIARWIGRWWEDWTQAFVVQGGRQDEWRFQVELPENLKLMDKAAGLDHRELTGRTLWLPGARIPADAK